MLPEESFVLILVKSDLLIQFLSVVKFASAQKFEDLKCKHVFAPDEMQ